VVGLGKVGSRLQALWKFGSTGTVDGVALVVVGVLWQGQREAADGVEGRGIVESSPW
jgi:hypothetical protein